MKILKVKLLEQKLVKIQKENWQQINHTVFRDNWNLISGKLIFLLNISVWQFVY